MGDEAHAAHHVPARARPRRRKAGGGLPPRGRAGPALAAGHTAPRTVCLKPSLPERLGCTARRLKELDIYQFEISLAKKKRKERERHGEGEAGGRLQTNSSFGMVEGRFIRLYWEVI